MASALNKTGVEVMLQNRAQSYIQEVLRYEGLVTNNQPGSQAHKSFMCEKAQVMGIPGLQGCWQDRAECRPGSCPCWLWLGQS